ncbi:unnamed protein product [Brassica oleracea var. botrytis]
MMSPTVHARRCQLYVMNENAQEALTDAFEAQVVSPEWPTALYLKAALLVQARHGPMHRKLLNTRCTKHIQVQDTKPIKKRT